MSSTNKRGFNALKRANLGTGYSLDDEMNEFFMEQEEQSLFYDQAQSMNTNQSNSSSSSEAPSSTRRVITGAGTSMPKKMSKFKQRQQLSQNQQEQQHQKHQPERPSVPVLKPIVERDVSRESSLVRPPSPKHNSFPLFPKMNMFEFAKSSSASSNLDQQQNTRTVNRLLNSDQEVGYLDDIDRESSRMLSEMSDKEINEERDNIMKSYDPAMIEMLKRLGKQRLMQKKNSAQSTSTTTETSSASSSVTGAPVREVALTKTTTTTTSKQIQSDDDQASTTSLDVNSIFKQYEKQLKEKSVKNLLGKSMRDFDSDKFEKDKLEWTNDIEEQESENNSQASDDKVDPIAKIRFGFKGEPIVSQISNEEYANNVQLFHHGRDPTKPGYTLPEILLLMRSKVPMQRVINMGLMSHIIDHAIHMNDQMMKDLYNYLQKVQLPSLLMLYGFELFGGNVISGNINVLTASVELLARFMKLSLYCKYVYQVNEQSVHDNGEFVPLKYSDELVCNSTDFAERSKWDIIYTLVYPNLKADTQSNEEPNIEENGVGLFDIILQVLRSIGISDLLVHSNLIGDVIDILFYVTLHSAKVTYPLLHSQIYFHHITQRLFSLLFTEFEKGGAVDASPVYPLRIKYFTLLTSAARYGGPNSLTGLNNMLPYIRKELYILEGLLPSNSIIEEHLDQCVQMFRLLVILQFYNEDGTVQHFIDENFGMFTKCVSGCLKIIIDQSAPENSLKLCSQLNVLIFQLFSMYSESRMRKQIDDKDESSIEHYRNFVEVDCMAILSLIQQHYSAGNALLQQSYAAIIHFCSTFFDCFILTNEHRHDVVTSCVRMDKFTEKVLLPHMNKFNDKSNLFSDAVQNLNDGGIHLLNGLVKLVLTSGKVLNKVYTACMNNTIIYDSLSKLYEQIVMAMQRNVEQRAPNENRNKLFAMRKQYTPVILNMLRLNRRLSENTRFLSTHQEVVLSIYCMQFLRLKLFKKDYSRVSFLLNEFITPMDQSKTLLHHLKALLSPFSYLDDQLKNQLNMEVKLICDDQQDSLDKDCIFDDVGWIFCAIDKFYLSDRGFEDNEADLSEDILFVAENLRLINYLSSMETIENKSLLFEIVPRIILFANMLKVFMSNHSEKFYFDQTISSALSEWLQIYHKQIPSYALYGRLSNIPGQEQQFTSLVENLLTTFMHTSYHNQAFSEYLSIFFIYTNDWSSKYRKLVLSEFNGHMLQKLTFFAPKPQGLVTVLAQNQIEKDDIVLKMLLDRIILYPSSERSDARVYTIWHANQYLFGEQLNKNGMLGFLQMNLFEDILLMLNPSATLAVEFMKELLSFEYERSEKDHSSVSRISMSFKKTLWHNYVQHSQSERKDHVLQHLTSALLHQQIQSLLEQ